MKKHLIIPVLAALTLASCGGGNTNQNNGASDTAATVETPQCDVSTTELPEPVGIAYDVLKAIANEGKYGLEKDDDLRYFFQNDESGYGWNPESLHNNNFGCGLDLLPLNNGDYLVRYVYTIALSDTEDYGDCTLVYKDGKLESAYNILPRPDARCFYSNYDKFPITEFQLLQNAMGCNYEIDGNGILHATLDPYYDLKDDYPESMKKFLEQKFPEIKYKWKDGKFEPDPENQAIELDLSACFGIESDDVREKKFLAALPKHYTDSVYEFSTESIDVDADFHSGCFNYYFPYKNKEGEYFVLSVFQQSSAGASSCDFSCFNYKDGKNENLEDFLPKPDVNDFINDHCEDEPELCNDLKKTYKEFSKPYSCDYNSYDKTLRYFLFFEDEELDSKFYDLTHDIEVKYKWNGETFIKQ